MKDVETPLGEPMKHLSEIYKDEAIKRCSCGSAAFFDCGIEMINSAAPYLSARYKDFADRDHVKICVECKKAIILFGGELYDASEYISADQIASYVSFRKASGGIGPTPGKVP
jgi:hypothetical protein